MLTLTKNVVKTLTVTLTLPIMTWLRHEVVRSQIKISTYEAELLERRDEICMLEEQLQAAWCELRRSRVMAPQSTRAPLSPSWPWPDPS